MTLTPTKIRCLLTLLSLSRINRDIASKDVASRLGVSRPSAHKMLDLLQREGLVAKTPYSKVRITEEGRMLAEELEGSGRNLLHLFSAELGLEPEEGSLAVALLMSGLKKESFRRLENALEERKRA